MKKKNISSFQNDFEFFLINYYLKIKNIMPKIKEKKILNYK
jgi:hypothetical protein